MCISGQFCESMIDIKGIEVVKNYVVHAHNLTSCILIKNVKRKSTSRTEKVKASFKDICFL